MTVFRVDANVAKAEKTATGTRVPIFTGPPERQVEIIHGLGRVPTDIWISEKDKPCDFYTVAKDAYRHIAVFMEANVNLYMRYE